MGTMGNLKRLPVAGAAAALLVLLVASASVAAAQISDHQSGNPHPSAHLTVHKLVVNDDGGAAVASDFSFSVNGGQVQPFETDGFNDLTIEPGTYTITEPAVAGYTTSYSNCSHLVVPAGGSATCTITNDDEPGGGGHHDDGRLTVIKHVVNDDGGTAVAGDWQMNVAGPTPLTFPGAENPGTTTTVTAGEYTVTESGGPSGYTLTYSGDCDANGNVTVPVFLDAVCTLTNDDDEPGGHPDDGRLIVIKHVVNDNGGNAVASAWQMNVAGPTNLSFAGAEAPGVSNPVDAGAYKVTESGGPAGYALSYSGDCDADGDVSVGLGQTKTCTLTNDDEPGGGGHHDDGRLTVIKHVVNDDGGTAVAGDWQMNVAGPTPLTFPGAENPGTTTTVTAGEYTVTESGGPSGYTLTYSGDCDANGNVTVPVFLDAVCTLTNDDDEPGGHPDDGRLIVIKHVVNDNGGNAVASAWQMNVAGPTNLSFAGAEAPGVSNPVAPAPTR